MRLGALRAADRRAILLPEFVSSWQKLGVSVYVESGLGAGLYIDDKAYEEAGATVLPYEKLAEAVDVLLTLQIPEGAQLEALPEGKALIGLLQAWRFPEAIRTLAQKGYTVYALERLPRITRAQAMDVLSAMGALAGYKAVLLAAEAYGRVFPMLTTAAGTLAPAKVLVIGAGVAGLQAIATARRLGAKVAAYDVRAAAREQVESLGATFLDLLPDLTAEGAGGYARALTPEEEARQKAALEDAIAKVDVLITTAAVPGRPAPKIVTKQALRRMQPGSIVVDLAAETGGNCEDTLPGQTQTIQGVTLLAPIGLPATLPFHASQMLSRNYYEFLRLFRQVDAFRLHTEDEILKATCVLWQGKSIEHPIIA